MRRELMRRLAIRYKTPRSIKARMLEHYFQQEVGNFCSDLTLDGLKLFTDYAIPLKDADDAWRKAYPELAEKFPEDEPAPDG
jgi:hypothetical protein